MHYRLIFLIVLPLINFKKNLCDDHGNSIFNPTSDLTISIDNLGHNTIIEAFKSAKNDLIINEKQTEKYGELIWHSIGNPTLIKYNDKLINLNQNQFFFYVEMLTDHHRDLFINAIKKQYKIEVERRNIIFLKPSNFECFFEIMCDTNEYLFRGKVDESDFYHFPYKVIFFSRDDSKERICLNKYLINNQNDLDIKCRFSTKDQKIKRNKLTITGEQLNNNYIIDDLFGNGNDYVYVTRNQLAQISSKISSKLNIVEEYDITEKEFDTRFVYKIISEIAMNKLESVPLEEAAKHLSKISNDDISPDYIYKIINKTKNLKSKSEKDEKNLETDKQSEKQTNTDFSLNFNSNAKVKGVVESGGGYGIKYGNKILNKTSNKTKLSNLNEDSNLADDMFEYEMEGNIKKPKSIKLYKLIRANFNKTFNFNRILQKSYESNFERFYRISFKHIFRSSNTADLIYKINNEISKLETILSQITNYIRTSSDSLDYLTSSFFYTRIKAHPDAIVSLQILSNGSLVSASSKYLKFWDTNSFKEDLEIPTRASLSFFVIRNNDIITFVKNSRFPIIVMSGIKKEFKLYEFDVIGPEAVALLPNNQLAIADSTNILIVDLYDDKKNDYIFKKKITLTGHNARVRALIGSKSGLLISGSNDETIKIWSKNLVINTIYCRQKVISLALSPNEYLISASQSEIKIWEINQYNSLLIQTLDDFTHSIQAIAVLNSGNLAIGLFNGEILIYKEDIDFICTKGLQENIYFDTENLLVHKKNLQKFRNIVDYKEDIDEDDDKCSFY